MYGALDTGAAPEVRSMQNYISLSGGSPGNSSWKTLENSQPTGIDLLNFLFFQWGFY